MSIVQNDTSPILLYMTLSSDHVSAATGKTVAVTLSKNGGAFAAGGGTVAELSNGWYKYTPVTADVGTLGDLGLRATATACDDWNDKDRVVQAGPLASDYTSARAAKLDNADASVAAVKAKTDNLPPDPADASDIAAAFTAVPGAVRTNLATELGRIDAAISSRAAATAISSGVTLTAGERTAVATALLATIIETNGAATLSVKQALQLAAALTGGKVSGITAGSGTQTTVLRSATDLQTIATYTDDELGNRSAVVITTP